MNTIVQLDLDAVTAQKDAYIQYILEHIQRLFKRTLAGRGSRERPVS